LRRGSNPCTTARLHQWRVDILHRGHVTYLAEASALGATLLVAVNGDASAKRLGKARGGRSTCSPTHGSGGGARSVHLVTWFDEDTPSR